MGKNYYLNEMVPVDGSQGLDNTTKHIRIPDLNQLNYFLRTFIFLKFEIVQRP